MVKLLYLLCLKEGRKSEKDEKKQLNIIIIIEIVVI